MAGDFSDVNQCDNDANKFNSMILLHNQCAKMLYKPSCNRAMWNSKPKHFCYLFLLSLK